MIKKIIRRLYRYTISFILSRRIFYRFNTLLLYTALSGLGVHNQLPGVPTKNEKRFLDRLGKRLKDNTNQITIIDVGANIGLYSAYVRRIMPDAKIYAFEPNPVSFEQLKQLSNKINLSAINLACSNSVTEAILYDFEDSPGSASATLNKDIIEFSERKAIAYKIQTLRLTDFFIENKIDHIHLLKVDAEGHDINVLEGAMDYIDQGKIDIIQFEFARLNCIDRTLMKDFHDILPQYKIHRLSANGDLLPLGYYEPITWELFGHQNLIAIHNNLNV